MSPDIKVEPHRSSFVEDLDEFCISGLQPMNIYRVQLSLLHKTKFVSYAFFLAGKSGVIDLSKHAPIWGYYKGVDKMGLFTSLYQDPTERFGSKLNLTPVPDFLQFRISVHMLEEPHSLASVDIERVVMAENVEREELEHETLEGVVFHPTEMDDGKKIPCILDLSGVGGNKEHRACFLAAHGYYVLSLSLYGKSAKLPKRHEDVNSEYIVSAVDYLCGLPFTTSQVVVIGTSLGGTWAFHTATRSAKVKAAININGQGGYYYVSQIKENGKTLPFVPVTPQAMANIEIINGCHSYAKMYGSCEAHEKHLIPIEKLESYQKLFYVASERDQAIDAIQQGKMMADRMTVVGKSAQFQMEIAEQGCHVIDPPFMPICDVSYVGGQFLLFGGDPYKSGCEQRRLWPRTLQFIRENFEELE